MYFLTNFPFMDLVMYYRGFSLYIVVGAFLNALETDLEHNFTKNNQSKAMSFSNYIFISLFYI